MATYEIKHDRKWPETNSDYDTAVYRDGVLTGEMAYNEITDCVMWWFVGPDGVEIKDNYANADMSAADLRDMIKRSYND